MGRISGHGRLIRCGRTSIVVGVDIFNEIDKLDKKPMSVGQSLITYSRLASEGRGLRIKSGGDRHRAMRFSLGKTPLKQLLVEKVGIQIINQARGQLGIGMTAYVRNSLNSLQGGIIALLADLAGQLTLSKMTGKTWQTRDLSIHYMTPGIKGPFETTAKLMRSDKHNALIRIDVLDRGDNNRLMAVIFNTCVHTRL